MKQNRLIFQILRTLTGCIDLDTDTIADNIVFFQNRQVLPIKYY